MDDFENRVYYESIKREPKIKSIYEYRCDERLQTKSKEFTRLPYTGLVLELEHLKIDPRLINENFANAKIERRETGMDCGSSCTDYSKRPVMDDRDVYGRYGRYGSYVIFLYIHLVSSTMSFH